MCRRDCPPASARFSYSKAAPSHSFQRIRTPKREPVVFWETGMQPGGRGGREGKGRGRGCKAAAESETAASPAPEG